MENSIKDVGIHYLYRHIRLDKDEPFYIGIGTKISLHKTVKSTYSRAYSKYSRTKFWKDTVAKTKYEVEILLESDDYEFIKQKEIEFIALYGRKNLNKGALVNLTDGGDGVLGGVGKFNSNSKPVFVYNYSGEYISSYESILLAEKDLNISRVCISKCINNENHQNLKFMFFKEFKGSITTPQKKFLKNYHSKKEVSVLNLDGSVFKIFESVTEASDFFKTGRDTITDNCNKEVKTIYKKYYLCYSKDLDSVQSRPPGVRVLKRLKMESDNQENDVIEVES